MEDGEHWEFNWRTALSVGCVIFLVVWFVWPWLDDLGLWLLAVGLVVLWWLYETFG